MASCLNALGRAGEALPLHEQALEARKRVLGEDHSDTLTSLNSLANCLSELGRAGEEWVRDQEERRLREAGRGDLATKVEWTSEEKGDGAGYDIRSFEADGTEIYIEVKTTSRGKSAPFVISRNEVSASRHFGDAYRIYRVFDFKRAPRHYVLSGAVEENCDLRPTAYEAKVGKPSTPQG